MAAAEFRTPGGLIVPASSLEVKADRSQAAMMRSIGGGAWGGGGPHKQAAEFLQAMRIPWVYRCVMTIATSFAASDFDLMEDGQPVEDPEDDFLQLYEHPNPWQTGFHFRELSLVYLGLVGENFITLENRDAEGRPREMYVVNPAQMYVVPDSANYVSRYVFRPFGPGTPGIPYEPDEVVHMKLPNPRNPYRGLGPVEASGLVLDIVEALGQHELSYYRSGGRIVGVLETENEVSPDEFERIKREWQEFSADKAQRLKTAILEAGLKYTPIAEGMRQIDATAINKEKRDAILATWGVPAPKIGIMENAQYKLADADRTFESETMMPVKRRWEDDIQPVINRFNRNRYMEFERKDFDDDEVKFANAARMGETHAFTVNQILDYLGAEQAGPGGDIIWVPSQLVPTPLNRLEEIAGAYAEETVNPPEAPPVPVLPEATATGPGSNNGQVGSGANPPADATRQRSPKVESLTKALDELLDRKDEESQAAAHTIIGDLARAKEARTMLAHRFARRQRPDRKVVRRGISTTAPATSTAMDLFLGRFVSHARERATPEIRRAFKAQRRKVAQAIPDLMKQEDRRSMLRSLERVMPRDNLEEAVRAVHVAGLVQGFHDGVRVLPPQHRELVRQKLQTKKDARGPDTKEALPDYIPVDSPAWRRVAEEWRGGQFPFLEASFDKMADRVTNIDETTRGELADTIQEGVRRGYSPMQIANGYEDEAYRGVAGVMDRAEDWRAEMIARTEAADAHRAGTLAGYATAEVPAVQAQDGDKFDALCRDRDGRVFPLAPEPAI